MGRMMEHKAPKTQQTKTLSGPKHTADQNTQQTKTHSRPKHTADQSTQQTKAHSRPRHTADQDTQHTKTHSRPRHTADQNTFFLLVRTIDSPKEQLGLKQEQEEGNRTKTGRAAVRATPPGPPLADPPRFARRQSHQTRSKQATGALTGARRDFWIKKQA